MNPASTDAQWPDAPSNEYQQLSSNELSTKFVESSAAQQPSLWTKYTWNNKTHLIIAASTICITSLAILFEILINITNGYQLVNCVTTYVGNSALIVAMVIAYLVPEHRLYYFRVISLKGISGIGLFCKTSAMIASRHLGEMQRFLSICCILAYVAAIILVDKHIHMCEIAWRSKRSNTRIENAEVDVARCIE